LDRKLKRSKIKVDELKKTYMKIKPVKTIDFLQHSQDYGDKAKTITDLVDMLEAEKSKPSFFVKEGVNLEDAETPTLSAQELAELYKYAVKGLAEHIPVSDQVKVRIPYANPEIPEEEEMDLADFLRMEMENPNAVYAHPLMMRLSEGEEGSDSTKLSNTEAKKLYQDVVKELADRVMRGEVVFADDKVEEVVEGGTMEQPVEDLQEQIEVNRATSGVQPRSIDGVVPAHLSESDLVAPIHPKTESLNNPPIIEAKSLFKTYWKNKQASAQVHALNGISFAIQEGEIVALVGASGSGKSTLLSILGGLDRDYDGSILVRGQDINSYNKDYYRRNMVGTVFQQFNLIPTLSVAENITLPSVFNRSVGDGEVTARLEDILHRLGLTERRNHKATELSGGQMQRVAIGRALFCKPKVLLADEPTGNLDSATGKEIIDLMFALNREEGTTLIIVTHDMGIVAGVDHKIFLQDGQIVNEVK
jgi:putative ABC transport system ATP-binding protein